MLRSASWQESQDTYVLKPGNDTNIMTELEKVNLNSLSLSFLTHETMRTEVLQGPPSSKMLQF